MDLYRIDQQWAGSAAPGALPSVTLRSGIVPTLRALPYWRERIKLEVRGAWHGRHTRQWLHLLNSHPVFSELVRDCPRLLYKVYRPYLSCTLPMDQRVALLASHYGMLFGRGLAPLVAQAVRGGVVLGAIEGKSGAAYTLQLHAAALLEREGELVLQLRDAQGPVYSVAFTFSELNGVRKVSVGCIQGPNCGQGLEAIRTATRELHGLRPKHLLVTLVRQLGHEFGCSELWLVGNANRVVHSALRQGRVRADYNQLWDELGAVCQPCGDYRLPCAPIAEPDLEAVQSKKRAEVRRRHASLTALAAIVSSRLCPVPQGAYL